MKIRGAICVAHPGLASVFRSQEKFEDLLSKLPALPSDEVKIKMSSNKDVLHVEIGKSDFEIEIEGTKLRYMRNIHMQ